jgi:hypothetical protein
LPQDAQKAQRKKLFVPSVPFVAEDVSAPGNNYHKMHKKHKMKKALYAFCVYCG